MNLRSVRGCILLVFLLLGQVTLAQKIVLATIENKSITADEVLYAYQKNRDQSLPITFDSLNEYLDKYINFKLKVHEARAQSLDTAKRFRSELNGYLNALKKPYAEGTDFTEKLITEAYERMQWQLKASHILIKADPDAIPADTIKAYEILDSLRSTILSKEDFQLAAKSISQDGSAQKGGDLGWFSVFMMVYPFETAAYNTEKNSVSEIVRTEFGYHLIYLEDKIKYQGKVRTSHIFFSAQMRSPQEAKVLAKKVYDSLKNGGKWNELTKAYSEDAQTKTKGGGLPFAGLKQLPDEYLQATYALNFGEISEPVRTSFGYHIIRLDDIQPVPELNMIKGELKEQIVRSGRSDLSDRALIEKLKNDYAYSENTKLIKELNTAENPKAFKNDPVLFKLKKRGFTLSEFIRFKQTKQTNDGNQLQNFIDECIIAFADSMAPIDYPEYGFLRQEYEEGLLLFEIMQQEVWNKALEDSIGQKLFYEANIEKYPSPERIALYEIALAPGQEAIHLMDSLKNIPKTLLIQQLSESNNSGLKIAKRKVPISELTSFEGFEYEKGFIFPRQGKIAVIHQAIPEGYFPLEEVRGMVIADYQEALDQQFIAQLRNKYEVSKDEEALRDLLNGQN